MSKRLLLIDDDIDDRDLFCEVIQAIDALLECQGAASGLEALKTLEKHIAQPDLIFLDINMPIMNGWECLTQLKKIPDYQSIPVVMYSTSAHREDQEKAQQLGALGLVTKPAEYHKLKTLLKDIISHLNRDTLAEYILQQRIVT